MMSFLKKICNSIKKLFAKKQTVVPSSKTAALIIGVENGFAGQCPGVQFDTIDMQNVLCKYTSNVTKLFDKDATFKAVKAAMEEACKSELAVIYYSGHGGQSFSGDPSEIDGRDEFMCLYDEPLFDNEIWTIISQAAGRVVLICDCCHSETMFRTAANLLPRRQQFAFAMPKSGSKTADILCWSGCPDDSYSYGDSSGGKFTSCFLKYYKPELTYAEVWNKIKADKNLLSYEDSKCTIIGEDFTNKKIFC